MLFANIKYLLSCKVQPRISKLSLKDNPQKALIKIISFDLLSLDFHFSQNVTQNIIYQELDKCDNSLKNRLSLRENKMNVMRNTMQSTLIMFR